jgi:hypothetical protein
MFYCVPKITRISAYIVLVAALTANAAMSHPGQDAQGETGTTKEDHAAVVISEKVVLKAKPSAEAAIVLRADRGTEFKVTGSTEGWLKVALKSGGEAWLPETEVGLKVNRSGRVCVEVSLGKALDVGALEGSFRGNGSSSGDSIVLKAKGTLTAEICPKFVPGTVLENQNAQAQNMVLSSLRGRPNGLLIVPEVELHFEQGIEAEYLFEAYCINFNKENPETSDSLHVKGEASDNLAKMLATRSSSLEAMQLAIWAITDDVSPHDANEKFGSTPDDIAAARKLIESAGLSPATFRLFRP